MTKEAAISLAMTQLDEPAKSGASSGHAVRIDGEYLKANAERLGQLRAELAPKLGVPFPPVDAGAVVPHWLVGFTFAAREAGAVTLKRAVLRIYDDGRVEKLPIA